MKNAPKPVAKFRRYPSDCMSMYCGKIDCPPECRFLPALKEFKTWRDETKAVRADEIWTPALWEATVLPGAQ